MILTGDPLRIRPEGLEWEDVRSGKSTEPERQRNMIASNPQVSGAAGRLYGSKTLVAILSALALLAAPLGLEAQGKGGGNGGGKPGGGGGEEPPPEPNPDALYTLTRIEPPAGTVSFVPHDLNQEAVVVGPTFVKGKGSRTAPGPAGLWADGQSMTLPLAGDDEAASAYGISDNGLIVGRSIGWIEWIVNGHTPRDIKPAWWFRDQDGFEAGIWQLPDTSIEVFEASAVSNDGRFVAFYGHDTVSGNPMGLVAEVTFDGSSAPEVIDWWIFESLIAHIHHDVASGVRVIGYPSTGHEYAGEAGFWLKPAGSDTFDFTPIPRYEGRRPSVHQVNGKGEVVGSVTVVLDGGWTTAVYFDPELKMDFLPTLGGSRSIVNSINDDSYAVGWSYADAADSTAHSFLWRPDVGMVNLNAITDTGGLELISSGPPGTLINNANHIVARAKDGNSSVYVLLTPIDEN